ncbi:hypothetical protein ACVWY2_009014 [Bradyrhizobium sp. JR6.1]
MKLGRIAVETPFGPVARLVAVDVQKNAVVDLASAEVLRRLAKGATREAAQRYASALFSRKHVRGDRTRRRLP